MYLVLLGLLGAVAGIGMVWWFFFRSPREEPSFFFRCPGCGQKLRYLARKAGRSGQCPRCKQGCTFPTGPLESLGNSTTTSEEPRVRFGRLVQKSAGKTSAT
jgi:hypothetical protein